MMMYRISFKNLHIWKGKKYESKTIFENTLNVHFGAKIQRFLLYSVVLQNENLKLWIKQFYQTGHF